MRHHFVALVLVLLAAPLAKAGNPDWKPLTEELVRAEKPGFGKVCGLLVDHATGAILLNLSDKGFYRSVDEGKSWQSFGKPVLKGRTEYPGCLQSDPSGKANLVVALVYGSPIGLSDDAGAHWKTLSPKSSHIDWCAVDWADFGFILALKHESGDLLIASHDGGKTFTDVGKGYGPAWIFDKDTAVVAEARTKNKQPGLLRTTDAGKTFERCGDYHTRALPRMYGGKLYWVVDGALIATTDRGASWKKLGALKDGRFGPIFGKSADHLFVLTGAGIVESKDGGATWANPIPLPKDLRQVSPLTWIDYDPGADILYALRMGSDLYQLRRAP